MRPPKGELESDVQEIGIVKQFAFSSELQVLYMCGCVSVWVWVCGCVGVGVWMCGCVCVGVLCVCL